MMFLVAYEAELYAMGPDLGISGRRAEIRCAGESTICVVGSHKRFIEGNLWHTNGRFDAYDLVLIPSAFSSSGDSIWGWSLAVPSKLHRCLLVLS